MASITVSAGQLLVNSGGMLVLTGGGQTVSSVAATGSDTITVSSGGLVSGLSIGSGTITVRAGGVTSNITVGSGGQENLATGGKAFATTVSSGGTLNAPNNAVVSGLTVQSGGRLYLPSGGGEVLSGSINVASGAQIELSGSGWHVAASQVTSSNEVYHTTITVVSGTTSRTETFDFTTSISFVSSLYSSPYEVFTVTCYAGGTEILTEHGAVPIETIKPADKVLVRRDGQDGLEPVTWVGSSSIDLRRHARPEAAAPIRIKASALADNVPARDLFVSPEHCLVLNGRCVPAKLLVNGASIVRELRTEPFFYYHLELEKHGILIAEGVEAESYLDTGNRAMFDNADSPRMLHPAFEINPTAGRWKTDACAPLASIEDDVAPIWQALVDRAVALGYQLPVPKMAEGPDLHVLADGKRIDPVSDRNARYVFTIPANVRSVSLMSRFCIPADRMVPNMRDDRRLGVRVSWIAIRSGNGEIILSADNPALRNGWHDVERLDKSIWRWTDGAATIPWENLASPAVLTVCCSSMDQYPLYDDKLRLVA